MPVGARVVGDAPELPQPPFLDVRQWVDICIMGQHLPQMYKPDEIAPLDADDCALYGLCPDCLGYGTKQWEEVELASGIDLLVHPCEKCSGTGRPAVRCQVVRTADSVEARIDVLPHPFVGEEYCYVCGTTKESEFHAGSN